MIEHRIYYKIRFPKKAGEQWVEWHSSNNGTNRWETLANIKSILTRGIQCGYHGKIHKPFIDYEVVRFTETVDIVQEVV